MLLLGSANDVNVYLVYADRPVCSTASYLEFLKVNVSTTLSRFLLKFLVTDPFCSVFKGSIAVLLVSQALSKVRI